MRYSNYTVTNTFVQCALDNNPNIDADTEAPYDWTENPLSDNWPVTSNSRCERYDFADVSVRLDCDGENFPCDFDLDREAIEAIEKHSGRKRENPKPT